MFKWVVIGVFVVGFAGISGLKMVAGTSIETTAFNRVSYLNQYEKRDGPSAVVVIKSNIVECLYDRAGGSIPKFASDFVVRNMLTLIRGFGNSSENFIQDWREKIVWELNKMAPKFSRLSREKNERIIKAFRGMEDGPHSLLGCVTRKMDLKI